MENLPMILIAGLLIGMTKGGLGAGLGAVITPLMILSMPDNPGQAVGFVLLMLIVGDWFALYVYWKKWDAERMKILLPAAFVGVVLGVILLTSLPVDTVKRLIALISFVVAGYKLAEIRLKKLAYESKPWHAGLAGSVAGFTSALANAGGPPFNAYMLLQKVDKHTFIATATLFFSIVNLMKLPLFLVSERIRFDLIPQAFPGMLMIPIGIFLGKKLIDVIKLSWFNALMWFGLVFSSLLLFINA